MLSEMLWEYKGCRIDLSLEFSIVNRDPTVGPQGSIV